MEKVHVFWGPIPPKIMDKKCLMHFITKLFMIKELFE